MTPDYWKDNVCMFINSLKSLVVKLAYQSKMDDSNRSVVRGSDKIYVKIYGRNDMDVNMEHISQSLDYYVIPPRTCI